MSQLVKLSDELVLDARLVSEFTELSECLASVDTPEGRRRVMEHLSQIPFPLYEAIPNSSGLIARIEKDGTRKVGRFINRKFKEKEVN